MIGEKQES